MISKVLRDEQACSLRWINNLHVYPCPDGEGNWELYIKTDAYDGPLGDRFVFGGRPPELKYIFQTFAQANVACVEWTAYFEKRLTEMT